MLMIVHSQEWLGVRCPSFAMCSLVRRNLTESRQDVSPTGHSPNVAIAVKHPMM